MSNWARIGVMSSILVWSHATSAPHTSRDVEGRVDEFVRAEMQREQVPGVAIGIVKKGDIIVAKGYGYANVEHHAEVTSRTMFQSGSVGKQFTAAAIMLQVEGGQLALDDPISKYFADAPESWRKITIRHLLTHTSGIPDYVADAEAQIENSIQSAGAVDYRRDYSEEELAKLARSLPLEFEPGTRWSYSNTGYVLLGIIIHKVSGQFYGDVLNNHVFAALGMKTARLISEADIVPNRAAGYRIAHGGLKNQEWVSPSLNTTADGSLYLSVLDLIAWDRGLRAHAILKPESWSQVYTPITLKSGHSYPYGFGWFIEESGGKPWYRHSGTWQGFETYISRYLVDDLTIVVLTNLAEATPQRFVDGIAMIIDPQLARIEPSTPIPDRDPDITKRVRALLNTIADGKLTPGDLPYVRSGFAGQSRHLQETLRPLGVLQQLVLVERRESGDDRVFTYVVVYGTRELRLQVALAPDNRVSTFALL